MTSDLHSTLPQADCDRLIDLLKSYDLPVVLSDNIASDDNILAAMQRDKKFESGAIRFVLLRSIGDAFVSKDITLEHLRDALTSLR